MILAGIDEAGLGPALGPLTMALTALRVVGAEEGRAELPWDRLAPVVSRERPARGSTAIWVGDSKEVYTARKLAGLELAVGTFLEAWQPGAAAALLAALAVDPTPFAEVPWYGDVAFPVALPPEKLLAGVAALTGALRAAGVAVAHLEARIVPAWELNRRFAATENKSVTAMGVTGELIRSVALTFLDEPIELAVDKQGGRNQYLGYLMELFPGAWIDAHCETPTLARYTVRRANAPLGITFLPKADREAFAVALASMFAKYLRERMMAQLNAWFAARIPGLEPTAGYHGDAPRFIAAVAGVLGREGIGREFFVRDR